MPKEQEPLKLSKVVFHKTVNSGNEEPETAFFSDRKQTTKAGRVANMVFTPEGVLASFPLCPKSKRKFIPWANVAYADILE